MNQSLDYLSSIDSNVEAGNYDMAIKTKERLKTLDDEMTLHEERIFTPKKLKLSVAVVEEAYESISQGSNTDGGKTDVTKLTGLSESVKKRVIGQDEAVDTVVRSLIRARLGLRSTKRPLGNFLFLGPTGVGKTELAKVLADEFFGDKSLIRLDMSDFSEKHNVARLVGAPPGYIGYGDGGELTTKIENNPDSVVLFDEIEKAHPDVLNILLQITEEGELTDARGSAFDFSKSVVILTSNLGTGILHNEGIGFSKEIITDKKAEDRLLRNLRKILKPELLNRFDELIVFKSLSKEARVRVINLFISDIQNSLRNQTIRLYVNGKVKDYLLSKGYSKEYGARSLRRTVEKELLDRIAEYLLEHNERPLRLYAKLKAKRVVITKKEDNIGQNSTKIVRKKRGRPRKDAKK